MQQWNDTSVHGPITRTVRDAALFMDAVVGYHPADPDSLPHPGISYAAILEGLPKKLRIAFHPDFGQLVQSDVAREIAKAASIFKDLGHSVTTIDDPVPDTGRAWMQVGAGQGYAMLHEWLDKHHDDFGRGFATGTEGAVRVTWKHMGAAYRRRTSSTIGASACSSALICCYARCCRRGRSPRRVRCRPRSTASR